MAKFAKVSRFADTDINLPTRKTKYSAGYDFEVAEDIIIPPMFPQLATLASKIGSYDAITLDTLGKITKENKCKPTLVSTGVKCYLDPDTYLQLSVRSSCPLKYWLILANGIGVIDSDYADNPDNEGEIFFQIINLGPAEVKLQKGDVIGQGVILKYEVTDDDFAEGLREGGFGSTDK